MKRNPSRKKAVLPLCLFTFLVLPALLLPPLSAVAATHTVTTLSDSDAGSLRQAISDAAADDTIEFNKALNGTINATSSLVIDKNLTLTGPGAGVITIDAGANGSVFVIGGSSNHPMVAISGLTITNGNYVFGGGINNYGNLTLSNMTITGNAATFNGGGIDNQDESSLNLQDCIVSNNTSGGSGGGIRSVEGSTGLTLHNTSIVGNTAGDNDYGGGANIRCSLTITGTSLISSNTASNGGGLFLRPYASDTLSIEDAEILNNTAGAYGGGILLRPDSTWNGTAVVKRCRVSGNSVSTYSGGGIRSEGSLEIIDSEISNNTATAGAGGGVSAGGKTVIRRPTLSENSAGTIGGGLSVYLADENEAVRMINSTVSGNTSVENGGGIWCNLQPSADCLYISFCTITRNLADNNNSDSGIGGGIYQAAGLVAIKGTIVAQNFEKDTSVFGGTADDLWGSFITLGDNFIGTNLNCGSSFPAGSPNTKQDWVGAGSPGAPAGMHPGVDPLADNGGKTMTHHPRESSPLLDVVTDLTDIDGNSVDKDQRGKPRPSGTNGDIGSVENQQGMTTLPAVWLLLN